MDIGYAGGSFWYVRNNDEDYLRYKKEGSQFRYRSDIEPGYLNNPLESIDDLSDGIGTSINIVSIDDIKAG